jgi:hypothetical protein
MYKKDLFKEWFGPHPIECGWYLDCPKDCTPSSKVSFHENFEPGFTKKALETLCLKVPKDQRIWLRRKGRKSSWP